MDSIVYSLQICLVFGVPFIFGWALLRRVFRESSWLALIPGSFIAGMAAVMATVNELRFFFDMRLATWFAYKLLLLLSLLLGVTLRQRAPRVQLPGCTRRPWQVSLLALGAGLVALYYGIPAFAGFLNDAWWHHYPSALQIQNVERFPLNHVFALDGPLYYHHGPDILAATWSFLLEIPVQKSWALYVTLLAPCSFLLAFALLARLARSYWAALFGATILVAGGNLRFLFFLIDGFSGSLGALQVLNSQTVQGLIQMIFTPSHALGVPLVLLLVLLVRHVVARPSWLISGAIGLLLGTLTLVAEWYFLPLVAGLAGVLAVNAYKNGRVSHRRARLAVAILPAFIALSWGAFNNTYLAGTFGHFWMRYDSVTTLSSSRQITARWEHKASSNQLYTPVPGAPPAYASVAYSPTPYASVALSSIPYASVGLSSIPYASVGSSPLTGVKDLPFEINSTSTPITYQPKWSVPNLVPLRLNLKHFGQVPSWESAASKEDSFIPIFGIKFFYEAAPVLILGIPFGLWLAWHRRQPVIILLAWLAASCAIPPTLLEWGYRSTDFLRFFTASYAFSALFTGWLIGELIARSEIRARFLGGLLATSCLVTPIALGLVGLMPGTIAKVNAISSGAKSLSQAVDAEKSPTTDQATLIAVQPISLSHAQAFDKLAVQTGDFLFPLAHGRERAIVIVPLDQIPEVTYFPEWMKLATLARIQLPIGWHWQDSEYSAFYRDASSRLDARAITSLDAKWVIVSNLFQKTIPEPVLEALRDRSRFIPIASFREGPYFMSSFRVLP